MGKIKKENGLENITSLIEFCSDYNTPYKTLKKLILKGRAKKEEAYYFIDMFGVDEDYENNIVVDDKRYEIGNYFKTKQEAEKALEKAIIYVKLKRFAETHNTEEIDWNNNHETKYSISYCHDKEEVVIITSHSYEDIGVIYFTSLELAYKAITEIGRENIKKLFI